MTTRFYDGDRFQQQYAGTENSMFNDPMARRLQGLMKNSTISRRSVLQLYGSLPVVENASRLDYHGYHAINFSKVDPRLRIIGLPNFRSYRCRPRARHENNPRHSSASIPATSAKRIYVRCSQKITASLSEHRQVDETARPVELPSNYFSLPAKASTKVVWD